MLTSQEQKEADNFIIVSERSRAKERRRESAKTGIKVRQGSNGRSRFFVSQLHSPMTDGEVNSHYELGSPVHNILRSYMTDKSLLKPAKLTL